MQKKENKINVAQTLAHLVRILFDARSICRSVELFLLVLLSIMDSDNVDDDNDDTRMCVCVCVLSIRHTYWRT